MCRRSKPEQRQVPDPDYERVRAIQNFDEELLPIPKQGEIKTSVLWDFEIQPTCCMEKLYAQVIVA